MSSPRPPVRPPTVPLLLLLVVLLAPRLPRAHAVDDMHLRMDELVDSVKHAVEDAEAAGRKREVVDLGQTLHLLESKFAGLRTALQQELGGKAAKFASHGNVAKELMDRSTDLVHGIVGQRDELRRLARDLKEVDSAIRAIREGMVNFEREVSDLSKVIADLHVSHNELTDAHEETKSSVQELMADSTNLGPGGKKGASSTHALLYLLVMAEIAILVLYLYMKRPGSSMAHKAYGKFG